MSRVFGKLTILVALATVIACSGPGGSIFNDDSIAKADAEVVGQEGDILPDDITSTDLHVTKDVKSEDVDDAFVPDVTDPDLVDPDVTDPDLVDPDVT